MSVFLQRWSELILLFRLITAFASIHQKPPCPAIIIIIDVIIIIIIIHIIQPSHNILYT